jgi:hypothetical protein
MPHLAFTVLTALMLAAAMAALDNRSPRERLGVAARFFAQCMIAIVAGGWLMRFIHG